METMGAPTDRHHQKVDHRRVQEYAAAAAAEKRRRRRKSVAKLVLRVSAIFLITALLAQHRPEDLIIGCQASTELPSASASGATRPHETEEERTSGAGADSGEPPVGTNYLAGPSPDEEHSRLRIVRLLAPEAVQNGTQNVTMDCMFKFDKKLDQRLTVKWFFNDELEPIYQWIPELNKRVYSDRYERFLDKGYELSEDVDFQLQAYRWLLADSAQLNLSLASELEPAQNPEPAEELARRRLLAGRINRLAKLGGRHSRQLLHSLRSALHLDEAQFSRFRALRLIQPTGELSGRFTCSVSSLDGDDLRSARLLVYEPAKSLSFNVTRISHHQYNLTCSALGLFPRPQLQLARFRAGPEQTRAGSRPKLAATSLRQEPLAGAQTQLVARWAGSGDQLEPVQATGDSNELQPQTPLASYDIHTWALVDDATLSSNVVTQFECLLAIEGAPYERRQSLALQRGWHVNANNQNQGQRQTLVGLFSALASLLCLILALICSLLIFRLLKRHARNRIHHQDKSDPNDHLSAGSSQSTPIGSSNSNSNPNSNRTLTNLATEVEPEKNAEEPEGVYRVPENSSFASSGTRFVIGGPSSGGRTTQYLCTSPYATSASSNNNNGNGENQLPAANKQPTYGHLKPLYC